ncbi:MAG: hypothetical protein ACLVKA_10710 [Collinsella aerofaciens]
MFEEPHPRRCLVGGWSSAMRAVVCATCASSRLGPTTPVARALRRARPGRSGDVFTPSRYLDELERLDAGVRCVEVFVSLNGCNEHHRGGARRARMGHGRWPSRATRADLREVDAIFSTAWERDGRFVTMGATLMEFIAVQPRQPGPGGDRR